MPPFLITLLVGISGICWSIVYVECIRNGFKQKTCCMPLFALALNFSWEGIYAFTDVFVRQSIGAQAIANACWFVLDILIVITWLKFGRKGFDGGVCRFFVPWTVLVIVCALALQLLFAYQFGDVEGEKYSAFLQNIVMSVSFIGMLHRRGNTEGQTMAIAMCKCVGTCTPTILGTLEGNVFILVTGIICFVFDVVYIAYLQKVRQLR